MALADPSGAKLLTACEQSLVNGFTGIEGMMCTWYVTPCDCDYSKGSETPRVCLPPSPDIEALAREVTAGLRAQPDLQGKGANIAAGLILTRIYPCSD